MNTGIRALCAYVACIGAVSYIASYSLHDIHYSVMDEVNSQRVRQALQDYEQALNDYTRACERIKDKPGFMSLEERVAAIKQACVPVSRALMRLQDIYRELGVPVDEIERESKLLCDACLHVVSSALSPASGESVTS